jgi:hypothetical protein
MIEFYLAVAAALLVAGAVLGIFAVLCLGNRRNP